MVGAGYFTDMPLYRSVPNFLVQFGIQKDHPSFGKFCRGPPIQDDQNHQMQVLRIPSSIGVGCTREVKDAA